MIWNFFCILSIPLTSSVKCALEFWWSVPFHCSKALKIAWTFFLELSPRQFFFVVWDLEYFVDWCIAAGGFLGVESVLQPFTAAESTLQILQRSNVNDPNDKNSGDVPGTVSLHASPLLSWRFLCVIWMPVRNALQERHFLQDSKLSPPVSDFSLEFGRQILK